MCLLCKSRWHYQGCVWQPGMTTPSSPERLQRDMATTDGHTPPSHTHTGCHVCWYSWAPTRSIILVLHCDYPRPSLQQLNVHMAMITLSCQVACIMHGTVSALYLNPLNYQLSNPWFKNVDLDLCQLSNYSLISYIPLIFKSLQKVVAHQLGSYLYMNNIHEMHQLHGSVTCPLAFAAWT